MPEETIWSGRSSQIKNLGVFAAVALADLGIVSVAIHFNYPKLLFLLVVTTAYIFFKWLKVQSQEYRLTTERILVSRGIFSRTTDSTELYRVKDLRITQPFFLRLFGLENIELMTSDQTTPDLVVDHIPKNLGLGDKCRNQIEACRTAKGTREVEVE